MEAFAERSGLSDVLARERHIELDAPSQVLLTGFVIMADWIASNDNLFPYNPQVDALSARTATALDRLSLTPLWEPRLPPVQADDHLRSRFDLPEGSAARPVQRAALELLDQTDEPGLFIIEAGMGVGKTESALLLAERLAAQLGLSGIYFALPSMSTSDAIFTRVLDWVDRLPDLRGTQTSIRLAHSKAGLNDNYRALLERGRFRGIDDDTSSGHAGVIAHSWFHGRKQATLADFAVGTIDQVLMLALQSKHVVLRHLGLAGKVVVVDECHAADDYMAVYLNRALEWLGALGVPVILLSATLPGSRRAAIVESYDIGRGSTPRRRHPNVCSRYDPLRSDSRYPLLTATTSGAPLSMTVEGEARQSDLTIRPLDDDLGALQVLLDERLSDGGCAAVIRNTVGRAVEAFQHLQTHFGDDVTLTHSRFVATDRLENDRSLLNKFGPPNAYVTRPKRHIVIATQVIEQSLDVDFDLMITDVAPVDLILQRSGRLHRHERGERPRRVAAPELFITGVDWQAEVPEFDRGAKAIYGEDALLRALATLDVPAGCVLRLPEDIARVVQDAYAPAYTLPRAWQDRAATAAQTADLVRQRRESAASSFLLHPPSESDLTQWDWQTPGDWKSEARGRAAVRDGQESVEVVVVQRRSDGNLYRWGALPDEPPLPTHAPPDDSRARRAAAATVALPPALSHPRRIDRTIAELETRTYLEDWQASPWLREQLILELDENCRCVLEDFVLTYSPQTGLTLAPNNGTRKDDDEL